MRSVVLTIALCATFGLSSGGKVDICRNLETIFQENNCWGTLEDTRFASITDELIDWKNNEEDECGLGSRTSIELRENDLADVFSYEISPSWVLDSPKIGACPYSFMKNRDDSRHPKMLTEVVCDCERSSCSMMAGYQCIAVRASIPVKRDGESANELLSVACVCARQPVVLSK